MTPQEKAKELVDSFRMSISHSLLGYDDNVTNEDWNLTFKQCALIAVDEIIDIVDRVSDISGAYFRLTESYNYGDADKEFTYWQQVKAEIEKI